MWAYGYGLFLRFVTYVVVLETDVGVRLPGVRVCLVLLL